MQKNREMCSYEKCLSCSLASCLTGQIARTEGKEAYENHIVMLSEAEEVSHKEYEAELERDSQIVL